MFDLVAYIGGVEDAKLVRDADALLRPIPGERPTDVTKEIRRKQAAMLARGWSWVFEHAREAQPRFHAALAASSPYLAVALEPIDDPFATAMVYQSALFVLGDGVTIRVEPGIEGFEADLDARPQDGWVRLYRSLPERIARAYYARSNGLDLISNEFYLSHYLRGLPGSLTDAANAIDYVAMPRAARQKATAALAALAQPESIDAGVAPADSFRVLLDTRSHDDESNGGDLLIYQAFHPAGDVFWVPGMAFDRIRRLSNAADAVDAYAAEAIAGRGRAFDFGAYAD